MIEIIGPQYNLKVYALNVVKALSKQLIHCFNLTVRVTYDTIYFFGIPKIYLKVFLIIFMLAKTAMVDPLQHHVHRPLNVAKMTTIIFSDFLISIGTNSYFTINKLKLFGTYKFKSYKLKK